VRVTLTTTPLLRVLELRVEHTLEIPSFASRVEFASEKTIAHRLGNDNAWLVMRAAWLMFGVTFEEDLPNRESATTYKTLRRTIVFSNVKLYLASTAVLAEAERTVYVALRVAIRFAMIACSGAVILSSILSRLRILALYELMNVAVSHLS